MEDDKNTSLFESEVKQNPQSFKSWWNYIEYFDEGHQQAKVLIFQRAIKELPGSYKLWYNYLKITINNARSSSIESEIRKEIISIFEECLIYMRKMPIIWKLYIEWLIENGEVTQMRKVFDRSIQSLPIGQHNDLWKIIMKFVISNDSPLLFEHLIFRHILYDKSMIGEYIQICMKKGEKYYLIALKLLIKTIGSNSIRMKKEEYDTMIKIIGGIDIEERNIDSEEIIRKGIEEFPEDAGSLWVGMGLYQIKKGRIESGIVILEEAMNKVITLRDLYIVRKCYEEVIENYLNNPKLKEKEKGVIKERKEYIMGNENIQMNLILLKKKPFDVIEWINRSHLFVINGDIYNGIKSLIEGIKTIESGKESNGKKYQLWNELIGWYLRANKRKEAKELFEKAKEDHLIKEEEAEIWFEMINNELKNNNLEEARKLCEEATLKQSKVKNERKIWEGYLRVEEQSNNRFGKWSIYERMIELKIITGREIIGYIEEKKVNNEEDEIWKIYEKGVELFEYPIKGMLYLKYIEEWCLKYGEIKKERTRDLFETAIENAPDEWKKKIFEKFIEYERSNNNLKRVIEIFKKEVNEIQDEDKYKIWIEYANSVDEVYGYEETKKIYYEALNGIGRNNEWRICESFAEYLEKEGDIEGAREIYSVGGKRCSVKEHEEYWEKWKGFEEKYGNDNNYKDYLIAKKMVLKYFGEEV